MYFHLVSVSTESSMKENAVEKSVNGRKFVVDKIFHQRPLFHNQLLGFYTNFIKQQHCKL